MRTTGFVPTIALTLGLALTPAVALAHPGGFHGGRVGVGPVVGGPVVARPLVTRPFVTRPFATHPFVPHRFFPRPFLRPVLPIVVLASPVVVYAPPPVYYGAPASYAPPAYYNYNPPAAYSPPGGGTVSVAPPPMPTVVQYPTGRYELRGDGITTPYTWVWIPNPPSAPPPAAPPTGEPASGDPPPARHSQLYRWTDEQGVVSWTDRWDAVPERYRTQAKHTQPS